MPDILPWLNAVRAMLVVLADDVRRISPMAALYVERAGNEIGAAQQQLVQERRQEKAQTEIEHD